MKLSKQIMATLGVVCVTSCAAMAGEPADIQAYAHPTLFGTQGHTMVNTDSNVIIGGKACFSKVLVCSAEVLWAMAIMAVLEEAVFSQTALANLIMMQWLAME